MYFKCVVELKTWHLRSHFSTVCISEKGIDVSLDFAFVRTKFDGFRIHTKGISTLQSSSSADISLCCAHPLANIFMLTERCRQFLTKTAIHVH